MNSVTPNRNERNGGTPGAGVAPAFVVAALALLLTLVMLRPGKGSSGEAGVVHAAEPGAPADVVERNMLPLPAPVEAASLELENLRSAALASEAEEPAELLIPCRVVDATGCGVRDAEVWVDDGDYRMSGRTAADGRFELQLDAQSVEARLASESPVLIGARHATHGPTLLVPWRRPLEGELLLTLRGRGATLWLAVVDPSGGPIGGAEVLLGDSMDSRRPTGAQVLSRTGELRHVVPAPPTSTDSFGQVELTGLEPGESALSVHAVGYCPLYGRIQLLDGETAERRIQLQPACAVRGQVRRLDGGLLGEARVLGAGEDPLSDVQTLCEASGEYLLEDLPAGLVQLFAERREDGQVTHAASAELELEPLLLTNWDGILTRVEEVHGRLLDSSGLPLVGWRVELRIVGDRLQPSRFTVTARDGRFSLPSAPRGRETELLVFHPDSAGGIPTRVIRDVQDYPEDCLLQLASGEDRSSPILGVIRRGPIDEAGELYFFVQLLGTDRSHMIHPDQTSGVFRSPAMPPGDYVLVFPRHGRGWTPDFRYRVRPGVPLDIGTVQLEPTGTLKLLPNREAPGGESLGITISLLRRRVDQEFRLSVFRGRADIPLEVPLAPGRYSLEIPSRLHREILFTIRSDEAWRVTVPAAE